MKEEKAFLRGKFVDFQVKIAELTLELTDQEQKFQDREKDLYLNLFEILDAFENLNQTLSEKEATFDKTTHMLARNVRSIHKKLIRMLKSRHIVQISFPDNRAQMEYCKVVDTREAPDMVNETILSVVKNGYMNSQEKIVLRKAEVVTVLNSSA
ncbi:MAG: nucleotide exchange factor GrpE [Desulfobacteraceae bacterium 4572_88]|nr:MAG: nucleotide exchange factor GrpE [Desulfobacteraceae bacterium 4572_88]